MLSVQINGPKLEKKTIFNFELSKTFIGIFSSCIFSNLIYIVSIKIDTNQRNDTSARLFAAAAFKMIPSVNRLLSAFQILRFSGPVIDLVNGELNLKNEFKKEYNSQINSNNIISLENISFNYNSNSNKLILRDVNLKIDKGDFIGFIVSQWFWKNNFSRFNFRTVNTY